MLQATQKPMNWVVASRQLVGFGQGVCSARSSELLSGQAVSHYAVYQRAEDHSDVRGGDFHVDFRVAGSANTPIQDPVALGIDRGLTNRIRQLPF
jgi:hypothetical protein